MITRTRLSTSQSAGGHPEDPAHAGAFVFPGEEGNVYILRQDGLPRSEGP